MMTFKECLRYIKSDLAMFPKKNLGEAVRKPIRIVNSLFG